MNLNGVDAMLLSPQRRRRSRVSIRPVVLVVASLVVFATACGSSAVVTSETVQVEPSENVVATEPASSDSLVETATTPEAAATAGPTPDAEVAPTPTPTPHPIAAADTELPSAPVGFDSLFETAPAGPQPVSIEIEDIDVRDAEIIPVGVNAEDLSFEVPPADQVGWYEFGSAPGQAGSAVLAAHIAYNGVDGVFRYLENVEIGAIVIVGFDDGSTLRYRITDLAEYDKEGLPDSLWAHDGPEQLALITCGGFFDSELNTYESNTVAIAIPV